MTHVRHTQGLARARGRAQAAQLAQERRALAARRQIGDVRLRRHVVEVDGRAEAGHLKEEGVDHLGQVRLAGVAVHESRQRDRVIDEVLDAPPDEELGVGEVGRDGRQHLELGDVRPAPGMGRAG